MDEMEKLVFVGCVIGAGLFLFRWYGKLRLIWPADRSGLAKKVFTALPAAAAALIFFALKDLASFDVVGSFTFVVFYILMGFVFIYAGMWGMEALLNVFWDQDGIHNGNRAAVPAVSGGFIAFAVIYSGANVGDGPGWWCVIVACGLGYAAWFALWAFFGRIMGAFRRVTVERDVCCGIRLCCYFIATAIILGRASAGDWTSFYDTLIEFADGWPALPLVAAMTAVELVFYRKKTDPRDMRRLPSSIFVGTAFIITAVLTIMYFIRPLPENQSYGLAVL